MHEHGTCPSADGEHCWTAHVVADHLDQGWARLCNGVILFDDGFFLGPDGQVQPIGGIQQKLRGARGKGATVFLVPVENCADAVKSRPDGLTLAKVGSLPDALTALAAVREGRTPVGC